MTFWKIFWNVVPFRPTQAMTALWWHLMRRRVRAKNVLKAAAADLPVLYRWWIRDVEAPSVEALRHRSGASSTFSVAIVSGGAEQASLERSLLSIKRQTRRAKQIIIPDGASAHTDTSIISIPAKHSDEGAFLAAAFAAAGTTYLLLLRAGDELAQSALAFLEDALAERKDVAIAYGDHDHLDDDGGRHSPWFKPNWDEDHFLAQDYLSQACVFAVSAGLQAYTQAHRPATIFELILKVASARTGTVLHLPRILSHRTSNSTQGPVSERAAAIGRQFGLNTKEAPYGSLRIRRELPSPAPFVSIIVPTRDKLELIEPCVRSVLDKTSYPSFEIIVVDNGSTDPDTLAFFRSVQADARVRVLPVPIPYNYSALNNLAVGEARGDFVCLLNNDTEVLEREWLTEMMRQAIRPEVGAVGAKLLYPDGSIQHAGVVVGMGDAAGHVHRFASNSAPGYFAQPHITRGVTAVTAACLLVAKDKYSAVGGLDQEQLAIAYNDIDFCLKLRRSGWRNIYVADAVLIHHESKSRIRDHAPSQVERYSRELLAFQQRWSIGEFVDPLFNPNLDPSSECAVVRVD
jgi:GT2 family glycosyltransferase